MTISPQTKSNIYSKEFDQLLQDIAVNFQDRINKEGRHHPFESIRLLKKFCLGAIRLPITDGGAGAPFVDLYTAVMRIAEVDPDVAHILRAHFMVVEFLLAAPESPLRQRLLEEISNGAIIGNAWSENSKHAAGGSKYETTLTKKGNHYVLNGEKSFCTGTYYSDYTLVIAMLEETPTSVIIPVSRTGVTMLDDWDGIGQKLTGSGTTIFENVYIDPIEILVSKETKVQYTALPQLYLQAIIAGILKNIVTDAIDLIGKRKRTFIHSNSSDLKQDVQLQQVIGQLSSFAFAAESIVLAAAKSQDDIPLDDKDSVAEHNSALKAAQAKVSIEEFAYKAATLIFEVGGASATKQSANLDRHWRNIRTLSSHNPTLYKERAIGNYHINGELLPGSSYF